MTNQQLIGTAFEYATISGAAAEISNKLEKLIPLLEMYKRSPSELKKLADIQLLMKELHFTYTSGALHKFAELQHSQP